MGALLAAWALLIQRLVERVVIRLCHFGFLHRNALCFVDFLPRDMGWMRQVFWPDFEPLFAGLKVCLAIIGSLSLSLIAVRPSVSNGGLVHTLFETAIEAHPVTGVSAWSSISPSQNCP